MNELWTTLANRAGLTLNESHFARLNAYLDILSAANERMNLTRITDRAQAEILHIADALTLLPHLPPGPHRLADVGSGGGVPGIVLAIVRPDSQILLIESTQKKAAFLREAATELKLENVKVDARRAEEVAHPPLRESFDVAVARAVALLPILVEWLLPLVKKGGKAIAMKGPKAAEELPQARRAIKILGGGQAEIIPVDLPNTSGHTLICVPKITRTDARYPRPPSSAKSRPL